MSLINQVLLSATALLIGYMSMLSRLFLYLALVFPITLSYKILVYNPRFGHSHSKFLGRITDTLVEAGHNVTSLIPIMNPSVIDGTRLSQKIFVQPDPEVKRIYETPSEMNPIERNLFNPLSTLSVANMFTEIIGRSCSTFLNEPGLIERLRAEEYDISIVENCVVCGIGISDAIQAKTVIGAASSCLYGPQLDEYGIEQALSYRSTLFHSSFNAHSFYSRLWNIFGEILLRIQFGLPRRAAKTALRDRFGSFYPSNQSSRIAYVFTNCDPLLDSATPTLNRIVDISNLGGEQPQQLNEYWEGVLTRRPCAILISFGSVVNSYLLPESIKMNILTAISRFSEITFIWKYEKTGDEFSRVHASTVDNLALTEWMPQNTILNHQNVVAFITHGGMGSVQETAARGVPGIFIPIFGDQPRNARMMELNGLGIVMEKFELHDAEKLIAKIREIVETPKYRENARHTARMIAAKPFTAREMLVKHVEFAAEFGASSSLRPQSHDMNFIEYHNLDIAVVFLIISVTSAAVAVKTAALLTRMMYSNVVKTKIQ